MSSDSHAMGVASYTSEYSERRYYGGGVEIRYYWVFEVQSPMGGFWGMQTVGFATKLCGGEWRWGGGTTA